MAIVCRNSRQASECADFSVDMPFTIRAITCTNNVDVCPFCRCTARVIAVWNCVDPQLVTQQAPSSQEQTTNELSQSSYQVIPTPRQLEVQTLPVAPLEPQAESERTPPPSPQGSWFPAFLNDQTQSADWTASSGAVLGASGAPEQPVYHTSTRLLGEHEGLLIDPGSVGNLAGERWARSVAARGLRAGQTSHQVRRQRPLSVSGVGNGSQQADYNVTLPISCP